MAGYIQAMGSQRVRHDRGTELTEKGDMRQAGHEGHPEKEIQREGKVRVAEALEIFRVVKGAPSGPVISEQSIKKCEG